MAKKQTAKVLSRGKRKLKSTKTGTKKKSASARKRTSKGKSARRGPQGKRLAGWELVTKEAVFGHLRTSKITVTALSKTLGVSPGAVYSWKAGRRFPSAEAQKKLADIVSGTVSVEVKNGASPSESGFSASALRSAREARGLSRGKLASQFGVSTSSLFNWESGKSVPRGHNLQKISTFMTESTSRTPNTRLVREGSPTGSGAPEAAAGAAQVASAYLAAGHSLTTAEVVAFVADLREALS